MRSCCWCTHRLESGNLGSLVEIVEPILHIVDCHPTIDAVKAGVGKLWDALVCTVSGFEVPVHQSGYLFPLVVNRHDLQCRCPIIREVF
jgi:hypothetical protein